MVDAAIALAHAHAPFRNPPCMLGKGVARTLDVDFVQGPHRTVRELAMTVLYARMTGLRVREHCFFGGLANIFESSDAYGFYLFG